MMMHGKSSKHSQSGVLRDRMEKAGFTHGREARANLRGLNVRSTAREEGIVYFCDLEPIDVVEVMQEGDGASLPSEVKVEDLCFAGLGSYDLQDVILSSNGVLRIKADERTRVQRRSLLRWMQNAWQAVSGVFQERS